MAFAVSAVGGAVAQETARKGGDPGRKIENIAGKHVRLVWTSSAKPGVSDPDSVSQRQQLYGFDSRDGKGVRRISLLDGNFSRPLLTPRAERVVYSRWNAKSGQSNILVTEFDGGLHSPLAPGFAIEVLKIEGSPKTWVYALDSLRKLDNGTWVAGRLVRFAIDQPREVGVVYEGEALVMRSVVLSPTGRSLLALRPDQGIGYFDIASGTWSKPLAEEEEDYAFDAPDGLAPPLADLGVAVAEGGEAHHVRVSKEPSIVVFSAASKPGVAGSEEIYLARLSGNGEEVEEVVVTGGMSGHADQMPDVWLGSAIAHPVAASEEPGRESLQWPVAKQKGALFWEDISEEAVRTMEFRILGKGRYGRGFVMSPEGGAIVPLAGSQRKIEAIVDVGGKFSIEFLLRGKPNPGAQVLFYSAGFVLVEEGGKLYAIEKDWGTGLWTMADYCVCDAGSRPRSVVYTRDGDRQQWFIDGEWASVKRPPRPSSLRIDTKGLTTYFSGWMEFSRIGFYPRLLTGDEVRAIARSARMKTKAWRPAAYREVEATLLEASEMPDRPGPGDSGRLLADHRYRIESVGKGDVFLAVGDEISVYQWAVLGAKRLAGFPREPGRRSFLALEPVEEHPEILLERRIGQFADRGMPAFLAVDRRLSAPSPKSPPQRRIEPEPEQGVEEKNVAVVEQRPQPVPVPAPAPVPVPVPVPVPAPKQPTDPLSGSLPLPPPPPPLPPLISAGEKGPPVMAGPLSAVAPPASRYPRLVPTYVAPLSASDQSASAIGSSDFSISEVRNTLQQAAELIRGQGQRQSQMEEAARMRDQLLRRWKENGRIEE